MAPAKQKGREGIPQRRSTRKGTFEGHGHSGKVCVYGVYGSGVRPKARVR